ncbi:MAG: hypothetical protein K0R73_1416 [Candidatus Midichloriaceae bacterium]|jgi:hypothetical protein|nr:hypothetical protein [Candidatus Midichloriaceae bacterium]
MAQDIIDYGKLVDEAMHVIVHRVLKIIQERGLPGNHHFFISFVTKHPGVKLSKTLTNKYPKEMTIVLQYQFQDLFVDNKGFTVTLSFNGIKEKIYIPFSAITTFADPSVQFGLQFREVDYGYGEEIDSEVDLELENGDFNTPSSTDKGDTPKPKGKKGKKESQDNVISLDKFRKK